MSTGNGGKKFTIPGEIRVKIPGLPWGTLVLVLGKQPDHPDQEFLVTPKWEPIAPPSVLTVNKTGGSIKQDLLNNLVWILRQTQIPAELQLAEYQHRVRLEIESLEEEPATAS